MKPSSVGKQGGKSGTQSPNDLSQLELGVIVLLFLFCFFHSIWGLSVGWNNALNDHFSFRQAQTAITAYYLKGQPFKLAYETPVLGKPWSIPMEFPIYQLVAARLSSISGIPLDQAGRAVSASCYLLLLVPVYFLLREFNVARRYALLVLCIFLASPYYLFWGRSFMIESTALFFSVSYLACAIRGLRKCSWGLLGLAVVFGIAGGLTKVTTWLPFLFVVSLWVIRDWIIIPLPKLNVDSIKGKAIQLFVLSGIPFLAALWWVKYSDALKSIHPLGAYVTSTNSGVWNYGTWDQKLSPEVWLQILGRSFLLFGFPVPAWLILGVTLVAFIITKKYWKLGAALLGLFLLSPMVFTNLHFIHDYYMNANGVFLITAVGVAAVSLISDPRLGSKIGGWFFVFYVLWSGVDGYSAFFKPIQEIPQPEIQQIASLVQDKTQPDEVVVILGFDWSSLVPYYIQRRCLMIPEWNTLSESQVQHSFENLKGEKIGMLLLMEPHRYPLEKLMQQAKALGFSFPVVQVQGFPQR